LWNQTRLVGLREQLMRRLRRWFLPYSAVFANDLAVLAQSWVLRAWLVLTALFALVTLLDHSSPPSTAGHPGGTIVAALLHPVDTTPGPAHTIAQLLKFYVVVWVSFVVVLTGGTISSELGVVADSVLSRGISRWQYFLGKWTSRLVAVLGVYLLVMVPTTLVIWLGSGVDQVTTETHSEGDITTVAVVQAPNQFVIARAIRPVGLVIGLARVAALLALVATCGVAFSASFGSTVISIGVGWVSIYGTGLILSVLDFAYFSPARLVQELPSVISGTYVATPQAWLIGGWVGLTLAIATLSGIVMARRDV